jgi:hypothetical protein
MCALHRRLTIGFGPTATMLATRRGKARDRKEYQNGAASNSPCDGPNGATRSLRRDQLRGAAMRGARDRRNMDKNEALLSGGRQVRHWPLAVGAVIGCVALVMLAVGVAAAVLAPQHVTNQQVTTYGWSVKSASNQVCPNSPDITRINESLTGGVSGDPRETGTAQVNAVGYEDDTNGAGFLKLTVQIMADTAAGPGTGPLVAVENGYVTLSNPDKAGFGNRLNGLLSGSSAANGGFPQSIVVTNLSGIVDYAAQGLAPVTITSLQGTLGDAFGPDGPLNGPQRSPDDNPGVFMPTSAC